MKYLMAVAQVIAAFSLAFSTYSIGRSQGFDEGASLWKSHAEKWESLTQQCLTTARGWRDLAVGDRSR